MIGALQFSRRRVLQGVAASAAVGPAGLAPASAAPAAARKLPARGNVVIRNAYVMTMEPGAPDIKDGDVHVRDGVIVAIGPEAQRARRDHDQRRRHDRAARLGRDPLAHVEHAAAEHVG